jgi:hypothetical protein
MKDVGRKGKKYENSRKYLDEENLTLRYCQKNLKSTSVVTC